MIAVGMRENEKHIDTTLCDPLPEYSAGTQTTDPYTDKHSRIVTRLLHYINVQTMELEEANQKLKHLAEIDNLTQTYNRLKLDNIIISEIGKSNSNKIPFSLILLDIEYFKRVNDTYGHLVGDEVLVQIAAILKEKREGIGLGGQMGRRGISVGPSASLPGSGLYPGREDPR